MSTTSIDFPECSNNLWETEYPNLFKCTNCNYTRPCHPRNYRVKDISKAQQKTIDFIRAEVIKHDGLNNPEYEYKLFEVTPLDWGGKVQVITEVGRVGDEGTMAQTFARTRRQIFLGPRGGMKLVNAARFIGEGENIKKVYAANVNGKGAVTCPTM